MKSILCILASIKPYEYSAKLTIDSIVDSANKTPEFNYDILYCGSQKPPDERVIFLQDRVLGGENIAINYSTKWGLKQNYKYFMYFSDDYLVDKNCSLFEAINFLNSEQFSNRKFKIATMSTSDDPACYIAPQLPYPNNGFARSKPLPKHMILRFPVVQEHTLSKHLLGYIFHPSLSSGYADNYLGFWVAENGEPGLECPNVSLHYNRNLLELDCQLRSESNYLSRRRHSCDLAADLMQNYKNGHYIENLSKYSENLML